MYARTARIKASSRRGTVMVLVVGVLAMLFIIGSTLLIVGRFERQTVMTGATIKNVEAVSQGILEPIFVALRAELLGSDDKAYNNRGWLPVVPGDDYFLGADYGDYPGFLIASSPRNGDLLLSSLEPYEAGAGGWNLFASSWFRDVINPTSPIILPPGTIVVGLIDDPAFGGIVEDADGDGIRDTVKLPNVGFSDSFGGSFSMGLRIIPHSGMVWLSRMTHPTLLAQVIHPSDRSVMTMDQLRTAIGNLGLGPADENDLRRRFMLPPLLPTPNANEDYYDVAPSIVQLFPITTGYSDPSKSANDWTRTQAGHGPVNQWLMFQPGQAAEWESLIQPRYEGSSYVAMTDSRYKAALDTYDRRHLISSQVSDDALRPQRDEQRLQTGFPFTWNSLSVSLKDIISPVNASVSDLAYGFMDYTASDGTVDHVFNTDGLRTQFSLRDVLEPNGQASYRRAMQLTAYFLAMIQHTSVPGSNVPNPSDLRNPTPAELTEQLRTAMQLAVNVIDFADFDDPEPDGIDNHIPTYFEFNGIKVVGVEKQPYITEAYVKVVYEPLAPHFDAWEPNPSTEESIYAVELYNPYDVPLYLDDYELVGVRSGGAALDLATLKDPLVASPQIPALPENYLYTGSPAYGLNTILPHHYVVIASRLDDPSADPGGTAPVFPPIGPNRNSTGDAGTNVVAVSDLTIEAGTPIVLRRKAGTCAVPTPGATVAPFYTLGGPAATVVDVLKPVGIGASDTAWAKVPDTESRAPGGANKSKDRLVLDSSLQRHKEVAGQPPAYWHFTLSRQVLLPLVMDNVPAEDGGGGYSVQSGVEVGASGTGDRTFRVKLPTDPSRPAQHSLLWSGPDLTATGVFRTQEWVASEFAGLPQTAVFPDGAAGTPVDLFVGPKLPIAPFPVLVADRGVHPSTGGTMAFPTTGTLLLVTRYAHLPMQINIPEDKPVSVAVTEALTQTVHGFGRNALATTNDPADPGQLQMIDNGHMPIFYVPPVDPLKVERCLDGNNSRFNDLPWGQLVFEYFTALPMEELARDLDVVNPGVQNLMAYASVPEDYLREYLAYNGQYNDLLHPEYVRFANYPVMMPVSQASSPLGPRVQGRIGIGSAPWWVLDGLPVLPDAVLGTNNTIPPTSYISLAGLPVPELESSRFDPYADPAYKVGARFVHDLMDEESGLWGTPIPPGGLPSISPTLAQHMVSYRENREIGAIIDARYPDRIGFATAGELCNVVRRVRRENFFVTKIDGSTVEHPTIEDVRLSVNTTTGERPFSYLGYLQLVTPIVRMQDWMTVKNHVFTIYATIQSSGQPPVTVRTQVTVDRTRCLYNPSDLPERITETPPISYYNAMDD